MIKLSIITINYNNAPGLQKTIDSVINQTSRDFEYIVIDGGSTDGSVAVIQKKIDKISFWVSEPDRGIYHAMNKGILFAKGEYCQFLNSGDYLLNTTVTEQMLNEMPECSIFYGNEMQEIDGKQIIKKNYSGRQITLLDMYNSTISHSSAYIKRSLFSKYGLYDESLRIVSDWKFYLIAVGLNNEKTIYVDINVVLFDSTGISTVNKTLDKKERQIVLEQVLPKSILPDYQKFARDSTIINRLKRNTIMWFFIINMYRLLFWVDKLVYKNNT